MLSGTVWLASGDSFVESLAPVSYGEVFPKPIMAYLLELCRKCSLVNLRATFLSVKEQQQALLLCLAKHNKENVGEFSASASHFLTAWNSLCARARDPGAPVAEEVMPVLESYEEFIKSSNVIDQFKLLNLLQKALSEPNSSLAGLLQHKVWVVCGRIVDWELQLLRCVAHKATVYTARPNTALADDTLSVVPEEELPCSLESPLARCPSLEDTLPRSPSLEEPLPRCPSLDEPLPRCPSLEDALPRCPSLEDALSRCPSLEDTLPRCPSMEDTLAKSQSVDLQPEISPLLDFPNISGPELGFRYLQDAACGMGGTPMKPLKTPLKPLVLAETNW